MMKADGKIALFRALKSQEIIRFRGSEVQPLPPIGANDGCPLSLSTQWVQGRATECKKRAHSIGMADAVLIIA